MPFGVISYGVRDKKKYVAGARKTAVQIASEIYYQTQVAKNLSMFDEVLDMVNAQTGIQTSVKHRFPRILQPVIQQKGFERQFFPEGYGRKRARELKAELENLRNEAISRGTCIIFKNWKSNWLYTMFNVEHFLNQSIWYLNISQSKKKIIDWPAKTDQRFDI